MNKTYTEINYQMVPDGLVLVSEEWFFDDRPVAECKGDKTAKKMAEEQNARAGEAWNMEKDQLNKINSAFGQYLSGKLGLDPALVSQMMSQALDDNATAYNNAGTGLRLALRRNGDTGGNLPMSGGGVRGIATLMAARAGDEANALRGIRMADAQQKIANQFNAGSLMSGNAATLNSPLATFTGGANSALASYLQSKQNGFLSTFGRGLGTGLAGLATGAIGNLFGNGQQNGGNR